LAGLADPVFSSSENLLKIVQCYSTAHEKYGTVDPTQLEEGQAPNSKVELKVEFKVLILKEISRLSNRSNFSLKDLTQIYASLDSVFKIEDDELGASNKALLKQKILESLEKPKIDIEEVVFFFEKLGFWKYEDRELEEFMERLELRMLQKRVKYGEGGLETYLDLYNR
jgi:hypothetical protein